MPGAWSTNLQGKEQAGVEASAWARGLECAVSVLRGLQKGNYRPELGAVWEFVKGLSVLSTQLEQSATRCPHIDTTDLCSSQKKVRSASSSCSGPLVPSTEKAQYHVDC